MLNFCAPRVLIAIACSESTRDFAVTVPSFLVEIVARSGERSRFITKASCSGSEMTSAVLDRGALQKCPRPDIEQSADMIGVAPILGIRVLPPETLLARAQRESGPIRTD